MGRTVVGAKLTVHGPALVAAARTGSARVFDRGDLDDPDLRWLALQWASPRIVIVPCHFGEDLVAVAIAPLARNVGDDVTDAAATLADRCAAGLARVNLLTSLAA
jgi:hypothetical protein